ncbi:amidohydrolase family protein [Tautonia sociabilis]|uniref:Amidohydrolase n=1 Tax=Tautonia sociabilis TaxID=2080755 RepID=A0A432MIM8_9BACT|nr:amidohydrolase family protein [Tautonia sociabilis]RUL87211.1 amidohydrolase [Tautonia sociabilis]
MPTAADDLTLACRFAFPVEGDPVPDARVTIRSGRILAVEPAAPGTRAADIDLGNIAILPGFVNAHTHLELSPLGGEPDRDDPESWPEDEIDWLRRVIAHRRDRAAEALRSAVDRNLDEAIRAGTTLLADTATAGLSWPAVSAAPLRAVVFAELIGLRRMRGLETNRHAWDWIGSIGPAEQVVANARPGLSPHAPYSTAGWLYHRSASSGMPLSTHLAELPEELELLRSRSGRLRRFLEDLGAWDDEWEPLSPEPADYVRQGALRQADWIIAHGTYLEPDDFWQLRPEAAPDGHRVAVAYCPRTHARFGHRPHPFRQMLEHGVVVCLGTDSRASAPSLAILDEIRFLRRRDPSLSGQLLLTMGTLFGAWALRADTVTGSLKPGKSADLALVPLPDRDDADPYSLLLDSDLPVAASCFEGHFRPNPDWPPGADLPSSPF